MKLLHTSPSCQQWLEVRPAVDHDYVFLNRLRKPIDVSGIQYRLKQYCAAAGHITELRDELRKATARLRHKTDVIVSCFQLAGLAL